jgi:isovaleryl-CoA dehydrogenase
MVMSGLDLERSMISPICLGICERALQLSIETMRARASSSASRSRTSR